MREFGGLRQQKDSLVGCRARARRRQKKQGDNLGVYIYKVQPYARSHFVCCVFKENVSFVVMCERTFGCPRSILWNWNSPALSLSFAVTDGKFMQTHSEDLIGFAWLPRLSLQITALNLRRQLAAWVRVRKLFRAFRKLSNLRPGICHFLIWISNLLSRCMFFWRFNKVR